MVVRASLLFAAALLIAAQFNPPEGWVSDLQLMQRTSSGESRWKTSREKLALCGTGADVLTRSLQLGAGGQCSRIRIRSHASNLRREAAWRVARVLPNRDVGERRVCRDEGITPKAFDTPHSGGKKGVDRHVGFIAVDDATRRTNRNHYAAGIGRVFGLGNDHCGSKGLEGAVQVSDAP